MAIECSEISESIDDLSDLLIGLHLKVTKTLFLIQNSSTIYNHIL